MESQNQWQLDHLCESRSS